MTTPDTLPVPTEPSPAYIADGESGQRSWTSSRTALDKKPESELQRALDADEEKQAIPSELVTERENRTNRIKRLLLIPLLCCAQFFDIFISSAALIALPEVRRNVGREYRSANSFSRLVET